MANRGLGDRKPHKRVRARRWFTATLVRGGISDEMAWLEVKTGARRVVVDDEGNTVSEHAEPGAKLWANRGDHVLIFGTAIDEVQDAEVLYVAPDGRLRVQLGYGGPLGDETRVVRVLASLKYQQKKRRAA